MLKKRLIPKLLIKHRTLGNRTRPVLVTTCRYDDIIDAGDPVSQAKIYEAQLADELIVLSIDGTPIGGDDVMLALIEKLASETFMPLCVGGGVRSVGDFALLLQHGADKVCINTAALDTPDLVTEAASRYGSQCVVVSIDFRSLNPGWHEVMRDRASAPARWDTVAWACEAVRLGAGELLLTDADRDGTGTGLNWEVARQVARAVNAPVIVSGGCGLAEHFVEGFRDGLAEGVAAGTFFCFRDQSPMQTRAHIRNAGVPIRMET